MLNQSDTRQWRRLGMVAFAAVGFAALGHCQTWTLQAPSNHPAALLAPQMAYDALHQKTVLFSGTTSNGTAATTPNDTWLWDGQQHNWTLVSPIHKPAGRVTAGMVYDSARQQIVMFGGGVGTTTFGDTWVWDGTDWTQKFPASSPPARQGFSMAYDAARQRVVLFGGLSASSAVLGDTWTWDGSNWTQQNPTTSPSPRLYGQLAYDEVRQEIVLFGGDDFQSTDMISITWVWNGSNWIARTPVSYPGATSSVPYFRYHSMVFDSALQEVVLFGGYSDAPQSATWLWDGTNWTQFAGSGPGARYDTGMAYDSRNQQVVVFGGDFPTAAGFYTFETWTFSTTPPTDAWVLQSPPVSPPARGYASMIFDSRRQQVVMFGGAVLGTPAYLGDTWTWNGTTWRLAATTGPAGRVEPAFAYDELRQQAVLFGGGGVGNDTWIWDGTTWTQKFPAHSPLGGVGVAMAYDSARQRVVLYGGKSGTTCLTDTWTWDGTDWTLKTPSTIPVPNSDCGAAMTYDDTRQQVILVTAVFGTTPDKTYTWDGANWTLQAPTTPLPQRYQMQGALAYDSLRQKAVQFGGFSSLTGILQETWQWDGSNWAQLITTTNPAARTTAATVFDPVRKQTVLFGGIGQDSTGQQQTYADTWTLGPGVSSQAVNITVPTGAGFTFNGVAYTGSHSIAVPPGTYTLSTTSPQATATGTQLAFSNWSDGGAISHSVTVPAGGLSITGNFITQYLLSTLANPNSGGTVSGGGYYNAGATASATATPNSGFSFANWSGACSGSGSCSVPMNAPATVTGNFNAALVQFTINVPPGVQFTFNGTTYTGTQTISLPPGSYPLSTTTPVATGAGTQLAFVSWSDGGAISHSVTLSGVSGSITGTFKTQYLLTTLAAPLGGGAVTPPSAYFDSGTVVNIGSVANSGFQFVYWGGACAGSASICQVLMSGPMTVVGNFAAGSQWVQLGPAHTPQSRVYAGTAYDSNRQELVMFGGWIDQGFPGTFVNETWIWNGSDWTLKSPATSPGPRDLPAMAYDPVLHQTVLFGGTAVVGGVRTSLGDTWVWDGVTWTQKSSAPSPSPRTGAAMAWDGSRLILFGGADSASYFQDTWAWDGSKWTLLSPAARPTGRFGHSMKYDPVRNQLVLFGGYGASGYSNETWLWTGSNWVQQAPASSPSARDPWMLAYDAVIQQVVLFSGNVNSAGVLPDEVWLWDGKNWKQQAQIPSPISRSGGAMAYDEARQQVLLFGGYSFTAGLLRDTWIYANNAVQQFFTLSATANPPGAGTIAAVAAGQAGPTYRAGTDVTLTASSTPASPFGYWSGACSGSTCLVRMISDQSAVANYPPPPKWIQVSPATMPSGRKFAPLAFDSARGETVLFGGLQEATGAYFNETWTWDGTTWAQQHPANNPSPRYGHAMGYDPLNHQMILFGGQIRGTFSSETWLWDGTARNWTLIPTAHTPVAGFGSSLIWDGSRLILFGGQATNGVVQNDTWAWTGSDWMLLAPANRPPARQNASMTYDAARNQILLFGGETLNLNGVLGDTWIWDGTNWTQRAPGTSPGARSRAVMAYHGVIQKVVLFSGFAGAAANADTWLWDGNNWTQRIETTSPDFQFDSAMVYDSARQQIVLLAHYAGDLRETWLYANNAVQQYFSVTTAVNPAGSGNVAVTAYGQPGPLFRAGSTVDVRATPGGSNEFQGWTGGCSSSFRHCVLVMTGNQTVGANFGLPLSWLQLNPATNAAAKGDLIFQNPISMAYDAARQQVVYFGGPLGDQTWTWNGSTWTKRTPAHSPPARSGHAMAYDAARQRVILFGGGNGTSLAFADTWSWDGTDWTLVDPGTGPAKRFNHAMAYDRARQEIVMFGGVDANLSQFYADTWAWNGTQWILRQASGGPPGRSDFGMAYDPVNSEVVIGSGFEGQNDMWGWNGNAWTRKSPAHLPPSTLNHFSQFTYDERLERTVMLLGNSVGAPQTWVWDGADWTQLAPTQNPTAREAFGIVYDGVRQQVLLFGGDAFPSPLNDTWVLAPPTAILTLTSVSATKDGAGNYIVTFTLKNTGNSGANSVYEFSATAVALTGGAVTSTNTFPSGQFTSIAAGATGTFQAQFPASAGSGAHSFSTGGGYGLVSGGTGNWNASVRSVVFP